MQGLILHAGANNVSRDAVNAVPTPPAIIRESGRVFQPIPHDAMVDFAIRGLEDCGFTVTGQAHALTRDGGRYFGLLEINNASTDFATVIGLRNGHGGDFAAGLVGGARVFVCDNLAFSGEVKLARAHTRFILRDLPGMIYNALGRVLSLQGKHAERIAGYQRTAIGDRDAHSLILRSFRAGAIGAQRIPVVLEQWETPKHAEFADPTLWRLYNAFTEAYKPELGADGAPGRSTLQTLPGRCNKLHALLDSAIAN